MLCIVVELKYCQLKEENTHFDKLSFFYRHLFEKNSTKCSKYWHYKALQQQRQYRKEEKNAIRKTPCHTYDSTQSIIILYFMTICAIKTFYCVLQELFIFPYIIHYKISNFVFDEFSNVCTEMLMWFEINY